MSFDADFFHLINATWSNSAFDTFFPWWTNVQRTDVFKFFFLPLILIATFYFAGWRGFLTLAAGTLIAWGADIICSSLIKPLFLRVRPYDAGLPFEVFVRVGRLSGTSFPSSHSLTAACLATFFALQFPRLRWAFAVMAFLIAYSRVYNGVHYPTDVFAGSALGAVFGWVTSLAYSHLARYLEKGSS